MIVNVLLVVINLVTSPGYFWAIWPLLGWGIGLAVHALRVFVLSGNDGTVGRLTERHRGGAGRQ